MNEEILKLVKRIKEDVDRIDPFNPHKAEENCDLKWQASNLLLLVIGKLENNE